MIIDIHTHVFPDELAERAIAENIEGIDFTYRPVSDGTVSGLLNNMGKWGIDVSVLQPVVMKQSHFKKVNEWTASVCTDRLLGFGGIYPHTDDYKRDIDFVVSLGLRGLKLHPEYQDFVLDDERMLKLYDYAFGKGLILLFHAGVDTAYPPPVKSTPRRFARVAKLLPGGTIIAAHLGGYEQWDDVETELCGKDIYLDTSTGFEYFSKEQFLRILGKHGADRILFASDAPWSNASDEMEHIKSLLIPDSDKAAILGGNAKRILNI